MQLLATNRTWHTGMFAIEKRTTGTGTSKYILILKFDLPLERNQKIIIIIHVP